MNALKVSIAAAVLTLTIQGLAPGQLGDRSHNIKDVTVERTDWYESPWSPCWSTDRYSDISNLCKRHHWLESYSSGSRYDELASKPSMNGVARQFVYQIILRNDSENTIRTVEWDYVFIDPMTQTEISRHHFNSEKKLRPHRRKTLVEYSFSPPTRVISIQSLAKPESNRFIENVVITRVTYESSQLK
jgi:hypothetical protein